MQRVVASSLAAMALVSCRADVVLPMREEPLDRYVEGWCVHDLPWWGNRSSPGIWFVEDDGTRHCVGETQTPELKSYSDRRVIAVIPPSARPAQCREPVVRILRLAPSQSSGAQPADDGVRSPPTARSSGEVMGRRNRWVHAIGAFTWLEPPFGGGYFWKGTFRLKDGSDTPVASVPAHYVKAFRAPKDTVTVVARVGADGELFIAAVCPGVVEKCETAGPY